MIEVSEHIEIVVSHYGYVRYPCPGGTMSESLNIGAHPDKALAEYLTEAVEYVLVNVMDNCQPLNNVPSRRMDDSTAYLANELFLQSDQPFRWFPTAVAEEE